MFLKTALYLIKKIRDDSKTVKHENTLYVDMYAGKIKRTSLSRKYYILHMHSRYPFIRFGPALRGNSIVFCLELS